MVSSSSLRTTLSASEAPTRVAIGRTGEIMTAIQDDGTVKARYADGGILGEGGMGEVRLCSDRRIGRDVAMKLVRADYRDDASVRQRFLREARVQGQLEHPSIVPVHDLGMDEEGRPFFTMKRIRGVTLEEIIARRRADPAAAAEYPRHRLLAAFTRVCLTIHYAHTCGVVHRDLKPGNIMLGDFGELYVLDWGLAKVGSAEDEPSAPRLPESASAGGRTTAGALMGTLGYMPPEQIEGRNVDARSDVYALGAILFEILTCQPLHEGHSPVELVQATMKAGVVRPSTRAGDVPPELDDACAKATHPDPAERQVSARELHDAIERYLEGDRDAERRRSLAIQHAERAAAAAAQDASPDARAVAMREISQALAFDPANAAARGTLVRLLTEPPKDVPAEVRVALQAASDERARINAGPLVWFYGTWFAAAPIMVLMGLHDWRLFAVTMLVITMSAFLAWRGIRDPRRVTLLAGTLPLVASAASFGCLVVTPILVVGVTVFYLMLREFRPVKVLSIAIALLVGRSLLEFFHFIPHSLVVVDGNVVLLPLALETSLPLMLLVLPLFNVVILLAISRWVTRLRDHLSATETRLQVQAWQLRQLIPDDH
jgi:eukaryotic-like serine/threonine-protein kinase